VVHILFCPDTASNFNVTVHSLLYAADHPAVLRTARTGGIQVHNMDPFGPGVLESAGHFYRIGFKNLHTVVVPHIKANTLSPQNIDSRYDKHWPLHKKSCQTIADFGKKGNEKDMVRAFLLPANECLGHGRFLAEDRATHLQSTLPTSRTVEDPRFWRPTPTSLAIVFTTPYIQGQTLVLLQKKIFSSWHYPQFSPFRPIPIPKIKI
jgi:hypothetical protein